MQFTPETIQFIRDHQHDDVRTLALQAKKYPGMDMPFIINQIAGRQTAEHKIPSWYATEGIIYPVHLSLEQCSSELTAQYKASLFSGETLIDLTGGFGIDCAFLSAGFKYATYIERQTELCHIATHNFNLLGLHHIIVSNKDSVEALNETSPVDCIFIDPARRNEHGGKTVLISDCEPDVEALEELLLRKASRVMIKLSPMLDLSLALRALKHTTEVHVISVQNECKELLLILENADKDASIHCVNFTHKGTQTFAFTHNEEASAITPYTNQVATYLYEPNASILKAGAFRAVASRFGLKKLHRNSHLYTSDQKVENFPGRCFEVLAIGSVKDKTLLAGLSQANITVRNFPMSVAELRKRTKLKDGGEVYLFATTLNDDKKVLIKCKR
ncbi:class I SAM-dependent methyltransferase [Bacteroides sp. 51]|uniref:THUMP-like domain-containing protein n=1 Tax=Bacteroides sp. 51 TaxID=2302938 RepID=UPI0013CF4732|nr:SAM-dependent methyltransferase [Bacteroides sp. 51]